MLTAEELKALRGTDRYNNLLTTAQRWMTECESQRLNEVQKWYKNLDMVQGRQYTFWNPTERKMTAGPVGDRHTPRLSVNIIEPRLITHLAKTGASRPSATVAPLSNEDEDIMAARMAESVWDWFQSSCQFQHTVFNPANYWRAVCGVGFIKTFYDETRTDPAAVAAQKQQAGAGATPETPTADNPFPLGALSKQADPDLKGVIRAIPVSPFHVYVPDMVEMNLQEQPYLIHVYMMSLERARVTFKDYVDENWAPSAEDQNRIVQLTHLGIQNTNQASKQIRIAEFYVKPGTSTLLPNGGYLVMAGDELVALSRDGMPYDHQEYPFAMLTGIETGRFYRKSSVESMISTQNEVNKLYSQIVKHKNLAIAPQNYYTEGAVNPSVITTEPGLFIPVRMGFTPPTPVQVSPLPPYTMPFLAELKVNLDDITGQHEVSRAVAPGADTAASAISILQEKDDDYLFSTFDSIRAGLETVARQVLSYAVQFWTEPRLLKTTGYDAAFEANLLKGVDLRGNTDIRFDGDSALPKSRNARIALVTEWIDKGYVSKEIGMNILEMGNLGKYWQLLKLDENAATRNNITFKRMSAAEVDAHYAQVDAANQIAAGELQQRLAEAEPQQPQLDMPAEMPTDPFGAGQPDLGAEAPEPTSPGLGGEMAPTPTPVPVPTAGELPRPLVIPVNDWDNHSVHMSVLEQLLKGEEYKKLDPKVQKEVADKWRAHQAMLNEQAMQQQALQAPQGSQQPAGPEQQMIQQ